MQVSFKRKMVCVFAGHECGKTEWVKRCIENYDPVVYDVLGEYDSQKFDTYTPKSDSYPALGDEFDDFLGDIREVKKSDEDAHEDQNWDMLVCDEASSVVPQKGYGGNVNNFLNYYRHSLEEKGWDMGAIFMARRPAKVHTDVVEVSKYMVLLGGIKGHNDIKKLNEISTGLGDAAQDLDTPFDQDCEECSSSPDPEPCENPEHRPFEFILVYPDRSWEKFGPL